MSKYRYIFLLEIDSKQTIIHYFNIYFVVQIIQNLHISHLELRDETSIDIMPYVNKRKVDIILVPLSHELAEFKDKYIVIMDRHVKFLMQYNILRAQTANISKGRVIKFSL